MDSAHPFAVLNKLNEQRSQGLFCDVTIVVEDVKFRAHKNILAACSRYFRNALTTPDPWTSGQVLELLDLKSEVFANILNFIYCSKAASDGAEDRRGLTAAGKRLGIPFLEMLAEEEKQDECDKSTNMFKKRKKDLVRADEVDGSRGPRITNAFSITEECPTNNPFTPLVEANSERQSPDLTQHPSSSTSCPNGTGETTHTLSEHSYAVNKSTEGKESSQSDSKKACKPAMTQPKNLIYKNAGPLKKRHRLRGVLGKSVFPAEAEVETPNTITPVLTDSAASVPVLTPPSLYSEAEAEEQMNSGAPAAADSPHKELGPPPLSPHTEDSILIYSCEHCPEIFSNKALLILHSEVHKKRFVSHLFCKFCHRKFIHLKRLRNHEQGCPKAARGPSMGDVRKIPKETDRLPEDTEENKAEDVVTSLSPAGLSSPPTPESIPMYQTHGEKTVKPSSSQRKYNCSVCKRVYVTLSSLKRHENVHSWRRAYPCHYCNKVFALAEYRTKHEIWHTGERRYQCIFCLETFMTYYILKNHQKSFHGIDPSLAVKKKSANGGLKGSVYPIKLYRLLPMKFRKRQYKTYSQTYSESLEGSEPSSLSSSSLISPFDDNGLVGLPDASSIPLTFMATTKMVSPVMPRISYDKPLDVDQSLNVELESQCGPRNEESRDEPFQSRSAIFSVQPNLNFAADYTDDSQVVLNPERVNNNVSFLSSMSTVKKLGELSASAKRVEDMTKKILQSSTENRFGAKTETYIAKPACQGASVDSNTLPLCQITVKIGNEAIIRRQIKGSKLFPRKKRRIRDLNGGQILNQSPQRREKSESQRLRYRPDATATETNMFEDTNDCDTADELWRPYYSYKAKKKIKKLRYKHRKALFHLHPEPCVDRTAGSEAHVDRTTTGPKQNPSNSSPRATYTCDICDSSFITETGLRAHVIGSHPYFCKTCGKQGPPGEAPAAADYICNSCMEDGSCFGNTPRSPNPEKKYRCSFCPQRFLYLATKRSHEKKHQETKGCGFNTCMPCSTFSAHEGEDSKRDAIKTEDSDNQGGTDIKSESMEGEDFSCSKSTPKREDTTDLSHSVLYEDVSKPTTRRPASPHANSMFSLTSPKVKHEVAKKWMDEQQSLHLLSKRQPFDKDGETNKNIPVRPGKNGHGDHDKSNKMLRRSDTVATPTTLLNTDKWVCKEEPLY
ncbi:zinc finger and BTB domain-containing protein 38 [Oryzias latipes]|uniref:zinc finger and BTB domain-containing protein 38 n=1 Tax=Oryzias latipes TaxID=8090 RepID=UPI0005CC8D47|nr:zinc finger and BTB domain-containing protein 38 [Oryzias latipes]XP_011481103.1 zinc finger and BTB domain-containing protein 38 [Oryzias latipes]XP_011481104.1 zinc finger and BTB domain-containing protein 38 [Oryzias latipes]